MNVQIQISEAILPSPLLCNEIVMQDV